MRLAAALLLVFVASNGRAENRGSRKQPAFPSEVRLERRTPKYSVFEVRFPTALPSRIKHNDEVWGHFYVPEGLPPGRLPPCVLVLPIMAGPNLWIETRFAESFVRRRLCVFLIELPFQFHRKPDRFAPNGEAFLARNPRRMRRNIEQSVSDVRRAISWVQSSGKADPERVAIFGISLGAIVGASVYSQDSRLKAGVFLLGGADIPHILTHSSEVAGIYPRLHLSDAELKKVSAGLDPLEFREANRGKRALFINALWDTVIPRADALKLAHAFPDGRQIWVPFGHYSSMLHIFWIRPFVAGRMARWLSAK